MPISATAIVSPQARLAVDVDIGPFCVVHGGVEIGAGSRIDAFCELGLPTPLADGSPLLIGANARIRSHSVFYTSSRFGEGLETGHRVTLREHTRAGVGLRIGTLTDVQGDCEFGDHVRLHSNVFVAKGSLVRSFVWLLPRVVLTNDPTPPSNDHVGCVIDEYAVISAGALVLPGVSIGQHALVAAGACVSRDVPAGMLAAGVPARIIGKAANVKLRDGTGRQAYPWAAHFHRGYPPDVVEAWCAAAHRESKAEDS